ncbi:MAG: PEGA domain-containing protein, partial [Myxococcota bacterium]|nr:PEGA domain-containing protein [Myxococcota bacterium]
MKNTPSRPSQTPLRGFLGALVLGAVLVSSASPSYARTFEEILEEAQDAREQGNMDRVLTLLREAYEIEPGAELLNNIARIYEQEGRYREAYKTYKKVSDDSEADPNLRNLDAARAAELRPMLTKAWVLPRIVPKDVTMLVDGGEPAPSVTDEIPLERGEHVLEVRHKPSGQVQLISGSYPLGQRSTLDLDLTRPDASGGRIRIADGSNLASLTIDGYRLRTPLPEVSVIRLAVGPHRIVTEHKARTPVVSEIHLGRGDLRALSGIVAAGTVQKPIPATAAPTTASDPIPADPEPTLTETAANTKQPTNATPAVPSPSAPAPATVSSVETGTRGGAVRVVCNVQGARGSIGGGPDEALTHTWAEIAPGTHFVTVTAESYAPWTRKVVVRTGKTVEIVAELSRTGRLKVTADGSAPSEVFFEGTLMGKTPALLDVATGTHVIVVKRSDGKMEEGHVTVGKEGTTTFHAYFGRKPGRVRHRAMPYSS